MDSLFRMRGSGISSDMEATVVAQFLAEIDGVESLNNVIVIGASNRQDLIDPAVLRPGRLDLKIKVQRPDANAGASEIFSKYLTGGPALPREGAGTSYGGDERGGRRSAMIDETIERMYRTDDDNKFLEVTYAKGEREIFYFKDFSSGAMIENIVVARQEEARRQAHHRRWRARHPARMTSSRPSTRSSRRTRICPNTTNPDDWARISGRKGERIINVRTLITEHQSEGTVDRERSRLGPVPVGLRRLHRRPVGSPHGVHQMATMAIPKVMGTEDRVRDHRERVIPDFDPISSCVLLVNAYREDHAGEILWDYDQENPLADARGFQVDGEKYTPNQQENIARNKTLDQRRPLLRRSRAPGVLEHRR